MSASTEAPAFAERDEEAPEIIPHDHPAVRVKHRFLVMSTGMAAMTMQMLDTTIANVALPHMQSSLSATQDTITWVLTSYILASAIALPLTGWLVDTIGIKRLLLFAVALFTVASALCGAAQSLEQMVLFRVLQGVAGAFLSPIAQTLMLDLSTPAERPRMMTIFTQGVMIGPILGPMLGGYLTENFDWRWVFYVNLPVGIGCILAILAFMPAAKTRHRPFDLLGWALVAIGVASLQLMLDRGTSQEWFASGEIVSYAVIAVCSLWMALVHITGGEHPLFPRALFADRNFAGSLILTCFFGLVLMSTMALLPTLLQSVYGYPVIDSGLLLAPRGVGMLLSMTVFGRFIGRVDPRIMLAIGFALLGVSLLQMSHWGPDMPASQIVLAGFVQGVGMSLSFVPLNLLMFATLPDRLRTDGSSLSNLMRNIGSSMGVTICTVLLARSIQVNHAEIGASIRLPDIPFALDRVTAFGPSGAMPMQVLDGMVNRQAAMIGYLDDFKAMAVGTFVFLPVLFLLKRPRRLAANPGDAIADAGH